MIVAPDTKSWCAGCGDTIPYWMDDILCPTCKEKCKKEKKMTKPKKSGGKPRKHAAMKSVKEIKKERLAQEVGELKDGETWSQQELDILFDLVFQFPIATVCKELKRSESSIESILWKIAVSYNGMTYKMDPNNRVRRDDKNWTEMELAYLKTLMEKDQKIALMADIFQRTPGAVMGKMGQLRGENRPKLLDLSGDKPVPIREGGPGQEILKQPERKSIKQHEGKKYLRKICAPSGASCGVDLSGRTWIEVDVYAVLKAYGVESQPVGHAIKKLLCAGQRSKGDRKADLVGAIAAIQRAIDDEEEASADAAD